MKNQTAQNISSKYQDKINNALNIEVNLNNRGKWVLTRTYPDDVKEFYSGEPTLEEMLDEYKSRKDDHGFSESERGQLLLNLLNDAKSLTAKLHQLIELEKKQSDD